jgi:hypothetical protein
VKEVGMRRILVVVTAMALVAGVAWVAVAGTSGGGRTPVNCMDTLWMMTAVSTSSTDFVAVPGFTDHPSAIDPISINVSALVSGAQVEFRVLSTNVGAQTHASKPGLARLDPNGSSSFAYEWVEPNRSAAVHVNSLELQWRSPSGNPVVLRRGDMAVQYRTEAGACAGPS